MNQCPTSTTVQKVLVLAMRTDLELLTAPNGQLGMKLAAACRPEVVVMDTELSDISAWGVLAQLRENLLT